MSLVWTREQFNEESKRLVTAYQAIRQDDKFAECQLHGWLLEADGYLRHPPIIRRVTFVADSEATQDKEDHEENAFWDNTILQDELPTIIPCAVAAPTNENAVKATPTYNNNNNNNSMSTNTKWHFSIVFSDSWKAPVLFFTVDNLDKNGSPCPRSDVAKMLRQFSHYNRVEDAWDLLSHDEHPITGIPSLFLHPCQTMQRMEILTQKQGSHGETNTQGNKALLLSWMTMILPSVGFSISSKLFQDLVVQF